MYSLPADPWFYAVAVPAVALVGLSKGGLGPALALIGVPLMALVVPPVQAAAILLPILIVMDIFAVWTWRGQWDVITIWHILPGTLAGVALGWLTAALVTSDMVKLLVGLISLGFVLHWVLLGRRSDARTGQSVVRGTFWGVGSGFTSFVAHAGGPPFQIYVLPLGFNPRVFTSTSVLFFAVVNVVKLVPYHALGQFNFANLGASLVLMPVAPLATIAGAWVVRRMSHRFFYPFAYFMILLVGCKLVWDGLVALLP